MNLFKFKNALALSLLLFTFSSANASVVYTFDVSDVSWATSSSGTTSNVRFWYEFTDTADLNSLSNSDLIGIGVITASGSESANSSIGKDNINNIFGISNGVASLTVGGPGSGSVWEFSGLTGFSMQVGQGSRLALFYNLTNGTSGSARNRTTSHTYYSISPVPVPAAVWLFGTALIGFVGMSRRRKVA